MTSIRKQSSKNSRKQLLEGLKENIPALKNINLQEVRDGKLVDQVCQIASMVPKTLKKEDLNRLCQQQVIQSKQQQRKIIKEQRILSNLQKNLGYSLYKEMEKVNPQLKRELENAQQTELTQKMELIKKQRHMDPPTTQNKYSIEIEEPISQPNFDTPYKQVIFKDEEQVEIDLVSMFDKPQPFQNIDTNNQYFRQTCYDNSYMKKKPDYNQVINLMDDLENQNPLHMNKYNYYDPNTDYSDLFIKKCFEFN